MTDRVHGITVALVEDIREDCVGDLITAISQLRGVAAVTSNKVEPGDFTARSRVQIEMSQALSEAMDKVFKP